MDVTERVAGWLPGSDGRDEGECRSCGRPTAAGRGVCEECAERTSVPDANEVRDFGW